MIVALIALLAVQLTDTTIVSGGRIEIPPRIAGAVIPYLQCTSREHSEALSTRGGGVEQLPLVYADMIAGCAADRARALEAGERLLRRDHQLPTAESRRSFVEASLSSVEQSYSRLHESMPMSGQNDVAKPDDAQPGDVPGPLSQAVPVGSWVIPPVVAPFSRRYTDCIEGHVSSNVVHPASTAVLRAGSERAVAACRDVRQREYAAALRAVENSREYRGSAEGRALVENVFRNSDMVRNRYGEAIRREALEQQRNPQAATQPQTFKDDDNAED